MILAHTLSAEVRAALPPYTIHASPTFVKCGPRRRGVYAASRLARTRRTDRRRLPTHDCVVDVSGCLHAVANAWSVATRL